MQPPPTYVDQSIAPGDPAPACPSARHTAHERCQAEAAAAAAVALAAVVAAVSEHTSQPVVPFRWPAEQTLLLMCVGTDSMTCGISHQ